MYGMAKNYLSAEVNGHYVRGYSIFQILALLCQYFDKKFRNLSTSLISLKILESSVAV